MSNIYYSDVLCASKLSKVRISDVSSLEIAPEQNAFLSQLIFLLPC